MTTPTQNQDPNPILTCAEFQEHLPELFANANGVPTDPALKGHLATCANCSALVRDLQYIADQARMLLEPNEEEPSDDVWTSIQSKLQSEGSEGTLPTPASLPS